MTLLTHPRGLLRLHAGLHTRAQVGGVAGDAAPLLVKARGFPRKRIAQSSPFPGATNTLTLELAINSLTSASAASVAVSKLVLSGVHGPSPPASGAADVISSEYSNDNGQTWTAGGLQSSAPWTHTVEAASITLKVAGGHTLAAGQLVVASFTVTNPMEPQPPPKHLRIAAVTSGGQTLYSEDLEWDTTTVLSFKGAKAGDARPLYVLAPGFTQ